MVIWERSELKNKAKESLRKGYWKIVLVSFIFALVTGGFGSSNGLDNNSTDYYEVEEDEIIEYDGSEFSKAEVINEANYFMDAPIDEKVMIALFVPVIFFIILIIFLISFSISIFVFSPLHVGCSKFFINQSLSDAELNEIGFAFKQNYKNVIKIMFFKSLYEFLWTLLFIIPGIIKSYEYRMIPYLLAEHPEMEMNEVFNKSRELMTNQKGNAFILDCSFIGWMFLGALTFGILNIFYVNPYVNLTNAELYLKLTEEERVILEIIDSENL